METRRLRFGEFELDVGAGELCKHGVTIRLQDQSFQILLMLLKQPGDVVLREEIRQKLWPNNTVLEFDLSIDAAIKRLRNALLESAEEPRYIETLSKGDYRFLGEVEGKVEGAGVVGTSDLTGHTISHYRIRNKLGSGGMGVVYRAEDLKLGRTVALKFLPGPVSELPASVIQRFEREARAASALNHANICTIHGLEDVAGQPAIVMELVEGETLAARLVTGPLPLERAVAVAIQIAAALAEAHRRGIVHRDVKPANIMLTKSGVKVLDFGLATIERAVALADDTAYMTQPGAIMGTVHYMSPEQLEGREADSRSDIFAFGLVFYEMLAGHRPFQGDSAAAAIGAILHTEPAPAAVPAPLSRIYLTCLAKDPDDRWQSARDLQRELEWAALPKAPERTLERALSRKWKIAAGACTALALALALLWTWIAPRNPEQAYQVMMRTPQLDVTDGGRIALSPDGRRMAMITADAGGSKHLVIRALDSGLAQAVEGADDIRNYPFWSPDGQSIGYFSADSLNRVDLATGKVTRLTPVSDITRGGSWANGQILFVSASSAGVYRIAESGGKPEQVSFPTVGRHTYPQFLPDGKRFLFTATENRKEVVRLGTLGSRETRPLGTVHGNVLVAGVGLLLFRRLETLVAQRVDSRTLAFIGPPVSLVEDVRYASINGFGTFAVSNNGVLAFRRGGDNKTTLRWFDREGRMLSQIGAPGAYWSFGLSPDESKIAVSRALPEPLTSDIWAGDVGRGPVSRLTRGTDQAAHPVWSPDGQRVCFVSFRERRTSLWIQDASGAPKEEVLSGESAHLSHLDWSRDGRFLAFTWTADGQPAEMGEIRAIDLKDPKHPLSLVAGEKSSATTPQFSADGHWLAYVSDETGKDEVYVRPFPDVNRGKWQVSSGGGRQPRWRADGREIFYLDLGNRIVAAQVTPQAGALQFGPGKQLFLANVPFSARRRFEYAVSRDGQRILANVLADEDNQTVDLFIHWDALLK